MYRIRELFCMQSYVILGHGSETFGLHMKVPQGCMLVLTEECGMLGTLPWQLYAKFSDPANKMYFDDPVTHKDIVEQLLEKPIRIFKAGENCPVLSYILLSYNERDQYSTLEPSGVYALPTPNFIYYPQKKGFARYLLDGEFKRAIEGAILPKTADFSKQLFELTDTPDINITQASLFASNPGIYYNLLCRVIKTEEGRVKELMRIAFPDIDVEGLTESYDFFASVRYWLTTLDKDGLSELQHGALEEIQALVKSVLSTRPARPNNVEGELFALVDSSLNPSLSSLDSILDKNPDLLNKQERRSKRSLLMAAAAMGHNDLVRHLLKRGAILDLQDKDGDTVLFYAVRENNLDTVDLLLAAGAKPAVGPEHETLLHVIANDDECVSLVSLFIDGGVLPNQQDEEDRVALHIAAKAGADAMIEELLRAGCDPNIGDSEGLVPLATAIEYVHYSSFSLLLPVTNLTVKTKKGTSLLGVAIGSACEAMALDLIDAGLVADWGKIAAAAKKLGMTRLRALALDKATAATANMEKKGGRKTRKNLRLNRL